MAWRVEFHRDLVTEFHALTEAVQDELIALVEKLRLIGPQMKRPSADALAGSRFANMKELRFRADGGVWRVAFAFDPERRAILLVGGDKSGIAQRQFYRALISKADARYSEHLAELERTRKRP
jgi:hypothetical protein